MVAADQRGTLIVSTAGNFFRVPANDVVKTTEGDAVLEKFLDVPSCRTLCAHPLQSGTDGVRLKLTNELPVGRNALVFFKVTITCTHFFLFFFLPNYHLQKWFLISIFDGGEGGPETG